MSMSLGLVLVGVLTGCGLFGRGGSAQVPESPTWREDAVAAIRETPGVTAAEVTVNDVDDGGGSTGPVVYGKFTVAGNAQAVVDDALLRLSEVLGPESKGVGLNLSVTSPEGTGQTLGAFGYGGARHGAALWEQTH